MNIPWWKNIWYIVAFLVIPLIVFIAYKSTSNVTTIISFPGQPVVAIEVFLRTLFNPLWICFLWLWDKGRKMNSEFHHDILKELKGVVKQAQDSGQSVINVKTLGDIILNHDDVEDMIRKNLNEGISMASGIGNPTIE